MNILLDSFPVLKVHDALNAKYFVQTSCPWLQFLKDIHDRADQSCVAFHISTRLAYQMQVTHVRDLMIALDGLSSTWMYFTMSIKKKPCKSYKQIL